jgi:hypothetical protein
MKQTTMLPKVQHPAQEVMHETINAERPTDQKRRNLEVRIRIEIFEQLQILDPRCVEPGN